MKNCKLVLDPCGENDSLYICELHFEKSYFTTSNELKTNAIPTIFRNGEGNYFIPLLWSLVVKPIFTNLLFSRSTKKKKG